MEKKAEYKLTKEEIQEGLDMVGKGYDRPSVTIEPPHVVLERRGAEFQEVIVPAFVKISTGFKAELKNLDESALKVWLYIALSVNRYSGKANPGLRTIARDTGLAINTIQSAIKRLETKYHLLTVDRESKKYNIYEPVAYVSANKTSPGVSEVDTDETVSVEPPSVSVPGESVSVKPQSVSKLLILNQINQSNQINQINNKRSENSKMTPEEKERLAVFTGRFGKFNSPREVDRFLAMVDEHGMDRVREVMQWAEKREIHMTNRPALLDTLETAVAGWGDRSRPKYKKNDKSFYQQVMEA